MIYGICFSVYDIRHIESANELLAISLCGIVAGAQGSRFLVSAKPQPKNVVQQADDNDPLNNAMADMLKYKDMASKKPSRQNSSGEVCRSERCGWSI